MIALTAWLGSWQSGRIAEKEAQQSLLESRRDEAPVVLTSSSGRAEDLLWRRLRASGRWLAERQVFVDNRIHEGRAGFHVVTPLAIEGGRGVVLVNRGWVARTAAYPAAPSVPVPEGRVTVEGLATLPPRRVLELSAETVEGNVWQNLSLEKYASRMRLSVAPVVILDSKPAPGLAAVTEKPDAGIDKHREYALTWYSLAATVAALWLFFGIRREAT